MPENRLERLIDANLNRLKEGLRVLEDVNRYLWDDKTLSRRFKKIRHDLQKAYSVQRLQYRDSMNDVQRESTSSEMARLGIEDLVVANFSRTQESARVLEETFKLTDSEFSELFKGTRYELYELEKLYFTKYPSVEATQKVLQTPDNPGDKSQ